LFKRFDFFINNYHCLENQGLKPTVAQNSIMNMLPQSPVTQLHEEIHIKDEPLIKNEFESSTETNNFSIHLESNSLKDLFCEQCKLQFDKKIVYDIHLKIVHKKDTIKVQDSRNDIPIETRCKPVNDTSTSTGNNPLQIGHESFSPPTVLPQDLISSENMMIEFNNINCPESHIDKNNLESLIESCPYVKCELCGYVPTTKNKYRERQDHLARVHFKDKIDKFIPKCRPYKCPEIDCLYVGKDNQSILRHFTGKHDILRKWVKEALSTKEIVKPSDSIQNVNSVIIEPLPKCVFCDTTFSNHFSLKEHQEEFHEEFHEGKKLHKCLTCDYKTSFKHNLVDHIKAVHERKKPHKCWICDYSFNKKSNLKQHISTVHEGKKRYLCSICDYSCYRSYILKEHIDGVHEGKFKCTLCNYEYTTKLSLRRHMKSSHDESNSKSSKIQGKNKNYGNITLQIGHESFSPPSVQPQNLISCENMMIEFNNINCPGCHIKLDKNNLEFHMARCSYCATCELCGYVPTTKNKYRVSLSKSTFQR
jgi:hypothetical protein